MGDLVDWLWSTADVRIEAYAAVPRPRFDGRLWPPLRNSTGDVADCWMAFQSISPSDDGATGRRSRQTREGVTAFSKFEA